MVFKYSGNSSGDTARRGRKGNGMRTLRLALLAVVAIAPVAGAAKDGKAVRVVEMRLEGGIEEQRSLGAPFGPRRPLLRDYTASIRKAAKDDEVRALFLRLNFPLLGLGKLQELREALAEFKISGKKVYCYFDSCLNTDYLLACSADRVAAPPGAMVLLTGISAEVTYLKYLLDWLGVKVELLHFGRHKTATEPFTQAGMSEENKKVFNELLDDLYDQFVATIAEGRKLPPAKVRELIDNGPYSARDARRAGLLDDVAYEDAFLEAIGKELGGKVELVEGYHRLGDEGPDLSQFNIFTLFSAMKPRPPIPKTDRPKVVIIFATGMIMPARPSFYFDSLITAQEMAKAFKAAREDPTVKAVVLRVDSPGGSALVSDLIWREVQRTRKAGKPVVASLASVAASGGYYIAMGADAVVAQPGCLTGSIGVLGGKVILKGLYNRVGITCEVFTRGRNAAIFSDYSPLSASERQRLAALMRQTYEEFVRKAAAGRGMPVEKMRELATGRVWTGREAKKLGLVDALGGLKTAYELAMKKAGLSAKDNVQPVILPREKSFLEAIFDPVSTRAMSGWPDWAGPLVGRRAFALALIQALRRERVLALMPFVVEFR